MRYLKYTDVSTQLSTIQTGFLTISHALLTINEHIQNYLCTVQGTYKKNY